MKNILVVDNEAYTVKIIKPYLEQSDFKIYAAYCSKQLLRLLDEVLPSLIIVGNMLPDMPIEKIYTSISEKYDVPFIILSTDANEDEILKGYNMGADDYIIKPFSPRQLAAKVKALLRWTSEKAVLPVEPYLFNNGELLIDTLNHRIKKNGEEVRTTPNEYKLLTIMIKSSKVFTRDELITKIFGYNYKGKNRVIDTYIKNLRHKIEVDPKSPQYILTVQKVGYRFGHI